MGPGSFDPRAIHPGALSPDATTEPGVNSLFLADLPVGPGSFDPRTRFMHPGALSPDASMRTSVPAQATTARKRALDVSNDPEERNKRLRGSSALPSSMSSTIPDTLLMQWADQMDAERDANVAPPASSGGVPHLPLARILPAAIRAPIFLARVTGVEASDEATIYRLGGEDKFAAAVAWSRPTAEVSSNASGILIRHQLPDHPTPSFSFLKIGRAAYTDNLFYEFVAGCRINHWFGIYPCFQMTYGLHFSPSEQFHSRLKRAGTTGAGTEPPAPLDLASLGTISAQAPDLTLENMTSVDAVNNSCIASARMSLSVQYFQGESLSAYLARITPDQVDNELPLLLYQVYFALSILSNQFTHYDLHPGNVLLVPTPNNQPVIFDYLHRPLNKRIRFLCRYVVKIIDYGRAWVGFGRRGPNVSARMRKAACEAPRCQARTAKKMPLPCGTGYGYHFAELKDGSDNGLLSHFRNHTTDLLLLHHVVSRLKRTPATAGAKLVAYLDGNIPAFLNRYTEAERSVQYRTGILPLHTVVDAERFLFQYIQEEIKPASAVDQARGFQINVRPYKQIILSRRE